MWAQKNEILLSCKGCLDRSSSGLLMSCLREVPGSHLTKWGQIAWPVVGCVYATPISVVAVSINLAINLILPSAHFSCFFSVSLYFVFYPLLSGLFNPYFVTRIYVLYRSDRRKEVIDRNLTARCIYPILLYHLCLHCISGVRSSR